MNAADLPEDFEEFWRETVAEASSVPLNYHRSLGNDFDLPGFEVQTLVFKGMGGRTLNGWIAYPPGARRLPSFVWVPPYGRESKLPDEYGTREGFTSLSFNFHGEAAFHQEKYVTARGYFAEGAEDPESWIFRRMFQDAIIATRVLQAQVETDEDRIGAMGMSQGAGMSIWLGAWCPIVKAVCADMTFLANLWQQLTGTVYRYPLKELSDFMEELPVGEARVRNTVSYYDTVSQAGFCNVPTQVSMGLKDPASRPENVRRVFEALPGRKRLITYDWGHDWHPDMIGNNRQWLIENLP
ncbi:acetylxylan esterase [Fimbriimonas ginsengisoli]|uniref:Acetyl xylan esterase n=1 Tax=Fimbriimonas ginsengisoli Gsoil 348 TaxID=661478 RepID=A0A068NVV6_FIMGI|nr:acetylxylan esterase [Fimbriimonas ginsengisoli]AIE87497.1 acetyl xylan esterase [Fimbriimonas ginsengisoli Gsoil 348]